MNIIRSLDELPAISSSVVTIGNFDGLHLGHAAILAAVRERATRYGARAVAFTFEPHPLELLAPDRAPTPISTPQQRLALIESMGMDLVWVQEFDASFCRLTPDRFVETYLLEALNTAALCVGDNFRFGRGHQGNLRTLRAWSNRFEVVEIPPVIRGGSRISSTRVRNRILRGEVGHARHLLGRCYEIEGKIVAGEGRGRKATVPTLNLEPENRLIPRDGVYMTRVSIDETMYADALTNVGMRPTFSGRSRTIETHVLAGTEIERGERLQLRFLKRLREEQRFPDADALRKQIHADVESAGRYFERLSRFEAAVCSPGGTP